MIRFEVRMMHDGLGVVVGAGVGAVVGAGG